MAEKIDIQYFDINVNNKHVDEDALPILHALRPHWKDAEICMDQISKGYVNSMTCFYITGDELRQDALVVRVQGMSLDDLGFERENELLVMQLAHAAGCFPPVYATFNNGVVYKYAPGRTLTYKDLTDPKIIKDISRKLYNFHQVEVDAIRLVNHVGEVVTFDKTETKLEQLEGMLELIPPRTMDPSKNEVFQAHRKEMTDELLKGEYDFIMDMLEELQLPVSLVHGDFHHRNMIINDETGNVNLIDFEATTFTYESLDLARFFDSRPMLEKMGIVAAGEPDLTEEHRQMYLRSYLDAKYESLGKKTDEVPEAELELLDVENRILQIIANFEVLVFTLAFVNMQMDVDLLGILPMMKGKYFPHRDELPGLKDRYLELKKTAEMELNSYIGTRC